MHMEKHNSLYVKYAIVSCVLWFKLNPAKITIDTLIVTSFWTIKTVAMDKLSQIHHYYIIINQ